MLFEHLQGSFQQFQSVLAPEDLARGQHVTRRAEYAGRQRFLEYVTVLENIVTDAVGAPKQATARPKVSEGWSPA